MKKEYLEPTMGMCEIIVQAVMSYSNESPGTTPEESPELAPRRSL